MRAALRDVVVRPGQPEVGAPPVGHELVELFSPNELLHLTGVGAALVAVDGLLRFLPTIPGVEVDAVVTNPPGYSPVESVVEVPRLQDHLGLLLRRPTVLHHGHGVQTKLFRASRNQGRVRRLLNNVACDANRCVI